MKTLIRLLMLPALIPVAATLNAATVKVTVTSEPADKMTDVRIANSNEEDSLKVILDQFKESLQRDAKRFLAADQTLDVHFTDIDLAGEFEPWHGLQANDIRWVRDIYIPRLKFDYKITNADGTIAAEGKANLTDPAFQMRTNIDKIDRTTAYERLMLTDWMRTFRQTKDKKG
jgi:hypothetical protein